MATVSLKAAEAMVRGQVVQVSAGEAELWDRPDTHPYGIALADAKVGDLVPIYRGGDDSLSYVLCEEEVFVGSVLSLSSADGKVEPFDPGTADPGTYYVLGSASTAGAAGTLCRVHVDRFLVLIPEPEEVG